MTFVFECGACNGRGHIHYPPPSAALRPRSIIDYHQGPCAPSNPPNVRKTCPICSGRGRVIVHGETSKSP
jgi:hypothetical protein